MSRYVYDTNPASRYPQAPVTFKDHHAIAQRMQSDKFCIPMCLAIVLFALGFGYLFFEPNGLLVQPIAAPVESGDLR